MSIINKVQFVDSLAEITRHHDRELMETSLLKTLSEYEGSQELWLYKVISQEPDIALGLLAHLSNDHVITANQPRKHNIPPQILNHVAEVIETKNVKIIQAKNSSNRKIIYPVFNKSNEVFAILIQSTTEINIDKQRLIIGLLRIYSNYLELIEHAKRDKLTGLLNRETLNVEITRILIKNGEVSKLPLRKKEPYNDEKRENKGQFSHWLGIVDIDHFKAINDNYGHLYGDDVLILVARLIEESIRDYDLAFRFGGEEFVILLEAYDIEDALRAFTRMNELIANHSFAKIEKLTATIGVTQIADQMGTSDVIGNADRALYYGKENGRDRVCIYENLVEQNLINSTEEIDSGDISFF